MSWGGGGCCIVFFIDWMLFAFFYIEILTKIKKNIFKHFVFSFHVFFAFYAISNIFRKGEVVVSTKIVVLASEPVGGRSRATELPCYLGYVCINIYITMRDTY